MKRFFTILAVAALCTAASASAQVSAESAAPAQQPTFNDKVRTAGVKADFQSSAQAKAERAAIRKERNTIECNIGVNGSLSNFNSRWQAVNGSNNAITGVSNLLFTHSYKKGGFTIDNKLTGKLGVTGKGLNQNGYDFTKSQDEWYLSTAPAYKMTENWNAGAILSLRSQFCNGVNGDKQRTSGFFAPAYLNLSLGFTYVCPVKKFPIKINLSPISMNATFVGLESVRGHFFASKFGGAVSYDDYTANPDAYKEIDRYTPYCYGLTLANGNQRYEGGSSVQIDFDTTFDKKGIFRYRTTFYSFYGWINEISQQSGENKLLNMEHILPTVRWEHTVDIKASKYFSTQFYFQMYYNKAQHALLQTQMVLGVGVSYTFKNK